MSITITPSPVIELVNEEEAWLHHVIADFDYIVQSGRYGPFVYDKLSEETKMILHNMYVLKLNNVKIKP